MRTSRYILLAILAGVMLLPVLAPVLLQLRLYYLRNQAEERLEQHLLETVSINERDVTWTNPGKEMQIGSRLFDVESYELGQHRIVVRGIFDDRETTFRLVLDKFYKQQKAKHDQLLLKYFELFAFKSQHASPDLNLHQGTTRIFNLDQFCSPTQEFRSIPTPPPQQAST